MLEIVLTSAFVSNEEINKTSEVLFVFWKFCKHKSTTYLSGITKIHLFQCGHLHKQNKLFNMCTTWKLELFLVVQRFCDTMVTLPSNSPISRHTFRRSNLVTTDDRWVLDVENNGKVCQSCVTKYVFCLYRYKTAVYKKT